MATIWCSVLDSSQPLQIVSARPRPFVLGRPPAPPERRPPSDLDRRTTEVRNKLRSAYARRFFWRYHPILALENAARFYGQRATKDIEDVCKDDLKFQYLFDMQSILLPRLADGWLIKKLISSTVLERGVDIPDSYPIHWTQRSLQESHFQLVHRWIWRNIRQRMLKVAHARVSKGLALGDLQSDGDGSDGVNVPPPPDKRRRIAVSISTMDMLDALAGTASNQIEEVARPQARSVNTIVDEEIEHYRSISRDSKVEPEALVAWWAEPAQTRKMPCMSQVAAALLSAKASTGGLECDLGSMNDVISSKRVSLGPGFVEASMMMKLNKHLIDIDPKKVKPLSPSTWKEHIPKRPDFADESSSSDEDDEHDDDIGVGSGLHLQQRGGNLSAFR